MIYFTSICSNYLPKAMALAESVKRNCRDATFVLCLVEREVPQVALDYPHFDEVVLAKDAGWSNFDSFIFRHSIVEASTAVKPRFMIHLTERYPQADKFVYLDPDVLAYGDFTELEAALDAHSIVLCPHLLRPGNIDMEISSLAHGTYNLGFLAVRRDENSKRFLEWWADRLFLFCYDDKSRGIFTDQKWIDLAPCFFDTHVLKHHGYDFATWSLLGSDLRVVDGAYVVNGDPLRFIHFSGLDSGTIDKAIGWWLTDDNREAFVQLYAEYRALLDAHGQQSLGRLRWSYNTYYSGADISREARVAYRDQSLWALVPDPFAASDADILATAQPTAQVSCESQASVPATAEEPPPWLIERFFSSVRRNGVATTLARGARKLSSGRLQ
ncbi:hypothetical protein DWG18_00355 [Lysobacter sp. TY2-98]|uniref:hypothetical protein n=1 Tax=Lysobacter sp. TY2-98 TaxID=2290922 RepID=UPI000E205386|nr:hypothetical protein [Lysobacter sp. TY2-98]AXK70889.1 hypothetical protein DWG18_00355 [Lysobacter sp. TY2-98]